MSLPVLPALCACGRPSSTTEPLPPSDAGDAFVTDGTDVIVRLTRIPSLTRDNSAVVLLSVQVIVVRDSARNFRAFSSECPHAGCGVSIVDGLRLLCPCHGSAFDFTGARLEGPAPRGLTPLSVALDEAAGTLRIRRG